MFEQLGEAEVQDLHRAIRSQLDVRRLEIAVDDASFMRRLERLGDLTGDRQSLVDRNRTVGDAIRDRFALDEFQDQRLPLIRFFETVNRGDEWMVQRGEHLRFAREARKAVGIERTFRGQDLNRDVAV